MTPENYDDGPEGQVDREAFAGLKPHLLEKLTALARMGDHPESSMPLVERIIEIFREMECLLSPKDPTDS